MDYLTTELEAAQLPNLLRRAIMVSDHPAQCDMLLLSTLTTLSYAMPNVQFAHGKPAHYYHPSLMTLVIAPPASGKGVMNLSRQLLAPIQEEKRRQTIQAAMMTPEGEEPPQYTAFVPSNSSSAAFMKLLVDNGGRGIMMETEADALTAAWKNDFANYSYAMRQAAEHETITKARKKAGETYLEVASPELTVLLSGTLGQLAPLIGSQENGLASRFITYTVDDIQLFDRASIHSVEDRTDNSAEETYKQLAAQVKQLYDMLQKRETPVEFTLTKAQADELSAFFYDGQLLALDGMKMPLSFDPVVKRMPVHILRIGAVLSLLRAFENLPEEALLPDRIVCHEDDFRTMMLMAEKLLLEAGKTLLMLPSAEGGTASLQDNRAERLLDELPEQFTTAEAIEAGGKMEVSRRSVNRILSELVANKRLVKEKKGSYRKA